MNQLIALLLSLTCLVASSQEVQVSYPYNPDFENDGGVGVEDLLYLLSFYGSDFDVEEININELSLSDWIVMINTITIGQQEAIDSLELLQESYTSALNMVSELQQEISSIQEQLDSLSIGVPTSGSDNNYSLECVEMGVAPLCSPGSGYTVNLIPADGYNYTVWNNGSSQVTLDLVQPTWRKFEISGLAAETSSAIVLFEYSRSTSSNGVNQVNTEIFETSVENGIIEFYVYGRSSNCQSSGCTFCTEDYLGMFNDAVAIEVNTYTQSGCYCTSTKSDFKISLNINGQMIDTNLRFNP